MSTAQAPFSLPKRICSSASGMLSSGSTQDQRRRPLPWRQMSASQRFQLLQSAISAATLSVTCSMNIVLCSTWTSTPIWSMCCRRSATLVISLASFGVVMVRPASCESPSSCAVVYAGKRKPRTLPSISQYCSGVSPWTSSGTGRYLRSSGSRYSQVWADSTTCASASTTATLAGAAISHSPTDESRLPSLVSRQGGGLVICSVLAIANTEQAISDGGLVAT